MIKMKGIFPVIHTPFTNDLEIDYEDLCKEVDAVINHGADGIVVFGYATEFPYLSINECDMILKTIVDECRGRIPIIPSVTTTSAWQAAEDALRYQDAGADALMLLPRVSDAVGFIQMAVKNVTLPIMTQYIPQVTGVTISAAEFGAVADTLGRPFGVKTEVSPEFISELVRISEGRIAAYTGNQGIHMYEALERGASGIMPGCSNVGVYKKIYNAYANGTKDKAFELYNRFVPYLNVFHGSYEIVYEKRILVKKGIFKTYRCRQSISCPDAISEMYFEKYCEYLEDIFENN